MLTFDLMTQVGNSLTKSACRWNSLSRSVNGTLAPGIYNRNTVPVRASLRTNHMYLFRQAVILVDSVAFEEERQGSGLIEW